MGVKRGMLSLLAVCVVLGVIAAAYFTLKEPQEVFAPNDSKKHTVIIDAGHGGEDGGAMSLSGLYESGINLEVAKKTDALMRFYGINTVMVRTTDISIHDSGAATIAEKKRSDLNNRVKIVNSIPDAVLLSIHQNSFPESKYFGAQVFYNDNANVKNLALTLQEQFLKLDADNTRKAKPVDSGVFLMNNVNCPAVLAECGFLTNPKDEKNLTDAKYQNKVAMALVSAYTMWE